MPHNAQRARQRTRALFARLYPPTIALLAPLLLFTAGLLAGRLTAPAAAQAGEPLAVQREFSVFWQAWNLAENHYVDVAALNTRTMVYGAISGMLNALGDQGHTRFLSPADAKSEQQMLSGQFVGIGVQVAFRNHRPVIVAPIHGSPGERAGLKAGDVIIKVDGVDTVNMNATELSRRIRGPAGTKVTITVLPPGQQRLVTYTIMRAKIQVPSVLSHALLANGHHVADIEISQFSLHANSELRAALRPLLQTGTEGAIIDLRNDPGGYRDQAIAITSEFLDHGNVLLEQNRSGQRRPFPVRPGGIATKLPMVVLVNKGTASAAEIMAGAIQDDRRGPIVGETTFGTGTVLQEFPLSDGSDILLGVDEWLTPDGHVIWHHGIVPNVPVALPTNVSPLTPDAEASLTTTQLLHNPDAQFSAALQQLLAELPASTPATVPRSATAHTAP